MNTFYFSFDGQKSAIRRVQCIDGIVRVVVADIFHAARNTNKNCVMKQFEQGTIRTVAEHVCPAIIEGKRKKNQHSFL